MFSFRLIVLQALLVIFAVSCRESSLPPPEDPDWLLGVKECVKVCAERTGQHLSAQGGYWGEPNLKLGLPPELDSAKVEMQALSVAGQLVASDIEDLRYELNASASAAADKFAPIAQALLLTTNFAYPKALIDGDSTAITAYFYEQNADSFATQYRTVIDSVDKTKEKLFKIQLDYAAITGKTLTLDLPAFLTQEALKGVKWQLGEEERYMRRDPIKRTSNLLRKIFG